MGLSCDGLGKERLSGAGRAHKQCSLGELCTDLCVLLGIVEEIHDLHQRFLRLVLAGDIGERDPGLPLHVLLGVALAHASHHAAGAGHPAEEDGEQCPHQKDRQDVRQDHRDDHVRGVWHIRRDDDARIQHPLRQRIAALCKPCVVPEPGVIIRDAALFRCDVNGIGLNLHPGDLPVVHHLDELAVGDLRRGTAARAHEVADKQQGDQRCNQKDQEVLALSAVAAASLPAVSASVVILVVPVSEAEEVRPADSVSEVMLFAACPESLKKFFQLFLL